MPSPSAPPKPETSPTPLPARTRHRLTLIACIVVGAMLVGNFALSDDAFPFAPFRMFSHANTPDGYARSAAFRAVTAGGDEIGLDAEDFGLRRAEIEGQLPAIRADHRYLEALADTYNDRSAGDADIVRLELVEVGRRIENYLPTDYDEVSIQMWTSDGGVVDAGDGYGR